MAKLICLTFPRPGRDMSQPGRGKISIVNEEEVEKSGQIMEKTHP